MRERMIMWYQFFSLHVTGSIDIRIKASTLQFDHCRFIVLQFIKEYGVREECLFFTSQKVIYRPRSTSNLKVFLSCILATEEGSSLAMINYL